MASLEIFVGLGDEAWLAVTCDPQLVVDAVATAAPTTKTTPANATQRMPIRRTEPAPGCANYQDSHWLWGCSM